MNLLSQAYRSSIFSYSRTLLHYGRQLGRQNMYTPCRMCSSSNGRQIENLSPFGALNITGNNRDLFHVQPVDPVQYPNQDLAQLDTVGQTAVKDGQILVDTRKALGQCDSVLKVPLKFSINTQLVDSSSVIISSLESRNINVNIKEGYCELRKVKCDEINISSESGDVKCAPNLHTNGRISVKEGRIEVGRVIGDRVHLEGEACSIDVKSSYVEELGVYTDDGDVTIDSLHRTADVIVGNGNVNIGSLDGNLRVRINDGDLKLNVTQFVDIFVEVLDGDVEIKLPRHVDTDVHLTAAGLRIDEAFDCDQLKVTEKESSVTLLEGPLKGSEEEKESGRRLKTVGDVTDIVERERGYIRVAAYAGNIRIGAVDWLSSLNLGELKDS